MNILKTFELKKTHQLHILVFKMVILNWIENTYFEIVKLYREKKKSSFIVEAPDEHHWLDVATKIMVRFAAISC